MFNGKMRNMGRGIIALLLVVLTIVSLMSGTVFAANEVTLHEGNTPVTSQSRKVLYNTNGTVTESGDYNTCISDNQFTLTSQTAEAELQAWITELQQAYYGDAYAAEDADSYDFPKLEYRWISSTPSVADISNAGDVIIYQPGSTRFTFVATANSGVAAVTKQELGVDMEKTFYVDYTFAEHQLSSKSSPLTDITDKSNFPDAGDPGSVIIDKSASTDKGYDKNGVAQVRLYVESLTSNEPIDVILTFDVSRSMVKPYSDRYDMVYCQSDNEGHALYAINKGYLNGSASAEAYHNEFHPIYEILRDESGLWYTSEDKIAYYCKFIPNADDVTKGTFQLYDTDKSTLLAEGSNTKSLASGMGSNIYAVNGTNDAMLRNYDKLNAARQSAVTFVRTLLSSSPESRVALVQFSDDVKKADGTYYEINSRVICNYTSDEEKLVKLLLNEGLAENGDNRYAIAGAGSGYTAYSNERYGSSLIDENTLADLDDNGKIDTTDLKLQQEADIKNRTNGLTYGLTLSNQGGTNYGLAFYHTEKVVEADNADPNTKKNDRQIVIFMTDGEPNTINLYIENSDGEVIVNDSVITKNGTPNNEDKGVFSNDKGSYSYFALRRQFEVKNRLEALGYEIYSVGFDLDSDGTGYFGVYNAGEAYKVPHINGNIKDIDYIDSDLWQDLYNAGQTHLTENSTSSEVLAALRKQVVKNIATYENAYYEVPAVTTSSENGTVTKLDYSGLNKYYKEIASSLLVKTTDAEVTDVIGEKYELRLLPYRNGSTIENAKVTVYSSSASYNANGEATYGTPEVLEQMTFFVSGSDVYYTDKYTDENGSEVSSSNVIGNTSDYDLAGRYFTFDSASKTFVWSMPEITDQKLSFEYDAYLIGSDPAYEAAIGRATSGWLTADGTANAAFAVSTVSGTDAPPANILDTNHNADITYVNYLGEYCKQVFEKPKLGWDTTEVTVTKTWSDNNYANRPIEIAVQLQASVNGGAAYDVLLPKTLNAQNGWSAAWSELPVYYDGQPITYSVIELNVPTAYDTAVGGSDSSFTITNTLVTHDVIVEYVDEAGNPISGTDESGRTVESSVLAYDNLPRGEKYDIVEKGLKPNIITSNGKYYCLVDLHDDSDPQDGTIENRDRRVIIVYKEYDSLYFLNKQVSLDKMTWQDIVTVEPGTTVYFRINIKNEVNYPISGLTLDDILNKNGEVTAQPSEWEAMISAFSGSLAAEGEWNSSYMSYTVDPACIDGDQFINYVTLANTNPELPALTDNATVNVTGQSGLRIIKDANVDLADDGKKYVAAGQRISFTLRVENIGKTTLTDIDVVDNDHDVIAVNADGIETTFQKNSVIKTIPSLAPGESHSFEVFITSAVDAKNGDVIYNSATASADDPKGGDRLTSTDDDTVYVNKENLPILSIVKKANNTDASRNALVVSPGDVVNYTVTVTNTGLVDADGVYVADYMLDGDQPANPLWAVNGGWEIDVPAGSSVTLDAQYTAGKFDWQLPIDTPAGTLITNVAELYSSKKDYEDGKAPIDSDTAKVTAASVYVIDITKTSDVATAEPNDELGYTIYVTNNGNAVLSNILITDAMVGTWGTMPERSESGSDVEVTVNEDNTLIISSLAPQDAVRLRFGSTVPQDISSSDIVNTVSAEAPLPDGSKVTDHAEATTGIFYNRLEVVKTANIETASVGDKIVYTITVTNTGESKLENVVVTDDMAVTVVSEHAIAANGAQTEVSLSKDTLAAAGVDAADYAPDTVIGYIPELAAGECRKFTVEYTVPDSAQPDDIIWNTAKAEADGGHEDSDSDDVEIVAPVVRDYRLGIVKTANVSVVEVGDTITYTITVTNMGADTLTNVIITDSLDVTYNGSVCSAGTALKTIPTLASGQSDSVTVSYVVPEKQDGDKVTNIAYADSDATEKVSNQCDVTFEDPSIDISKTVNTTKVAAGQKVYYTLVVTNTGNCKLTDLVVEDAKIGYKVTIDQLDPGEKWTSPNGALYYIFDANAALGNSFENNVSVANSRVMGASDATTTVSTNGQQYAPNTGEKSDTSGSVWLLLSVSAFAAVAAGIGIFIRKRLTPASSAK